MANNSITEDINRLALSGDEITALTKWDDSMVTDYLGIHESLLLIAEALDGSGAGGVSVITAWVLFDGVTASIIDGSGISGVSRLAQGRYSIVFTDPMNNANYATFINVNEATAAVSVGGAVTDLSETVTGVNIFTTTVSSATSQYKDFNRVSVSIVGGMN